MLKIPRPTFICPHCSKVYRRKREFELHKSTCRIIEEDICEKDVEERQDFMSHHELCDIVKLLVKEQNKLKNEVKTLKTQLATIRKKVSIEDYLSKNNKPSCEINAFSKKLSINMDYFLELLDDKLEKVLEKIVLNVTPELEEIPIRTFTGHTGTIYCFDNNNWRKMNDKDWKMLSGVIIQSLMDCLKKWTDKNEHRLEEDSFSLRYNTYVQKIMNCINRIQIKLMAIICQRVKISLNGVTTFEFTFSENNPPCLVS
jgi:hypothetical protein